MTIRHTTDEEFMSICKKILKENISIGDSGLIESSDQFQTTKYCGGFDGTENQFTFSCYDRDNNEFWF